MSKDQRRTDTIEQPREGTPAPAKSGDWQNQADGTRTESPAPGPTPSQSPNQGANQIYDTPHEGAVRDEGTETPAVKREPRR